MSGQIATRRLPNKSWAITILFAILSAAAPFINEPLEKYFGITLTENEINHLLTMFLGSAAIGGVNAAHKRRERRKAVANDPTAFSHAMNQATPQMWTPAGATQMVAPTVGGGSASSAQHHITDPSTGDPVPNTDDLHNPDEYDDDDDDIPPPKAGAS